MKKLHSLITLVLMTVIAFTSCSKDDDATPPPTPTPKPIIPENPLKTTWKQINDVDPTTTTTINMASGPYIDYSAINTSMNSTIPEGTPAYSKAVVVDPTIYDPYATKSFSREDGYYTMPAPIETKNEAGEVISSTYPFTGSLTYWPQVAMTSADGATWTSTPKANMLNRAIYDYEKNGSVLILTLGATSTLTYIDADAVPEATAPADVFFKTWTRPRDAGITEITLVMSPDPYQDLAPAVPTNPTIPADAPSYVRTEATSYTPGIVEYTKELGYLTLPPVTTVEVPVTPAADPTTDPATDPSGTTPEPQTETISTIPSKGILTFWVQRELKSFDGATWTETPVEQIVIRVREYTYELVGNVMKLTSATPGVPQTTIVQETYYTRVLMTK